MFQGYITNEGSVIIIGNNKEEVEAAFKENGLKKSHIKSQHLYPFKHNAESSKIEFGIRGESTQFFGRLSQYEKTVQEEVAKMGQLSIKIHTERINDFLSSLQ